MIIFNQTEKQLSLSEIQELEDYVSYTFPEQYKEHLIKYNGGKCEPNIFTFTEEGKVSESCIDWFLAIYEGEYDNLKETIKILKKDEKRMPEHIIPIAHDPLGNMICISCGEKDYGYIYFWDHEKEVDYSKSDDSDYSNLYLIDKSFNEFLNNLKDDI